MGGVQKPERITSDDCDPQNDSDCISLQFGGLVRRILVDERY